MFVMKVTSYVVVTDNQTGWGQTWLQLSRGMVLV